MGHSGQWEAPIRAWNDAIGLRRVLREGSANFEFQIKEEIRGSHRVNLREIVHMRKLVIGYLEMNTKKEFTFSISMTIFGNHPYVLQIKVYNCVYNKVYNNKL